MKAYWGVEVYLHTFLTSPRPLYSQEKKPWYPLNRRLGGPQNRSERSGEEKNSQPLPWLEPPIIQAIAQRYTAELTRLQRRAVTFYKRGIQIQLQI
jgi:hypothetical protein